MIRVREATRADHEGLCALEARTPLEFGEHRLYFHRSDFFAGHDLQERAVVMLAEDEDAPVGVCAGSLNEAPLAGEKRLLLYMHHARIAPERQREGIGGRLATAIADYWKARDVGRIDSSYWFIGAENAKSRAFAERPGTMPWPTPVRLVMLEARPGGARPRQVGAGPIFDIVRLINLTHAGKDLFTPYEQVEFGKRLSGSIDYGWGDVYGRFVDGRLVAVAGVWDAGRTLEYITDDGPAVRPWWVADWGHEPGAEAEMVALLDDICQLAYVRGRQGVSFFPDPLSPLYAEVARLPHEASEMLFYAPRIAAPARPAALYVDPLMF